MDSTLSVELYFRLIKRTEMYAELHQYLVHYKILPVPGIGTFSLQRQAASGDFPNRLINAPVYMVSLKPEIVPFPKHFFSWLGHMLGLQDREASARFQEFADKTLDQVKAGDIIHWKGVGTLSRQMNGGIKFSPDSLETEAPVKALKVIRENAGHTVRVGEDQKTSAEMTRMLNVQETKRSYDWLWPALLAFLSVLFIGWYLSSNGVSTGSTGNNGKIKTAAETTRYEQIQ